MEEETIVVDSSVDVEEETSQIEETLEPTLNEETTQQDTNTIDTNYTQQLETLIEQQQDINLRLQNIDRISQNIFGVAFLVFVFWLVYRFILRPFFGSL